MSATLANNKAILAELFRDNPTAISGYLTEKFVENSFDAARASLYLVVHAQNVKMLARDAGLRRDTLYRTFGGRIDPQFSRILKLFAALNVHFQVAPSVEGLPRQQGLTWAIDRKAPAEPLGDNPQSIAGYLTQALEENDFEEGRFALGQVVHAQNISSLGRLAGIQRRTLYKTFGGEVDPHLSRILKLFAVLNVRFAVIGLPHKERSPRPKLGRPRKLPASNPE